MDYKLIELSSWSRKESFLLFRAYQQPHFSLTTRLDVSRLLKRTSAENLSSYRACMYAVGCGINAVPEMRLRFKDSEIRLYEGFDLSMTVPKADNTLAFGHVPFKPDFASFDVRCKHAIEQAGGNQEADKVVSNTDSDRHSHRNSDAVVYLSCLPWLDFSSISNAMPGPEDCIPRVAWGKYMSHSNKTWSMAMAIQVHHALVDGYHVAQFFNCVQDVLNNSLSD